MTLAADIQALRDRVLADLNAAHNYHEDTKTAWRMVVERVTAGESLSIQNVVTGDVTTQVDLAAKAKIYVSQHLTEATFQQFMSIFENFLFDLLRLWLLAYPRNLVGKKVDFQTILDAPDKDAIALHVVDKELNEILYERPAAWFAYLE